MRKCLAVFLFCAACHEGGSGTAPVDASKAENFVAYQEKLIPLLRAWVKTSQQSKLNGQVGRYGGGFAEKYDGIRKDHGLSEDELHALSEIAAFVAARDGEMKQRFAAQSARMEKVVAAGPADQREAARKRLDALRRVQANVLELREMRERYGDAIVVAMLQREPELKRQRAELASIQ